MATLSDPTLEIVLPNSQEPIIPVNTIIKLTGTAQEFYPIVPNTKPKESWSTS